MRELLFIALIVACPLMMMWMMRGGHGHGGRGDEAGHMQGHGGGCGGHSHGDATSETSTDDLRRQRDELDHLIEKREAEEETPTPIGSGRR